MPWDERLRRALQLNLRELCCYPKPCHLVLQTLLPALRRPFDEDRMDYVVEGAWKTQSGWLRDGKGFLFLARIMAA